MKMYRVFFICLLIITGTDCFSQTGTDFIISVDTLNITEKELELKFKKSRDSIFFEDDRYVVSKTCSGEFGGSIWFRNKVSGVEYSCEATCAVVIYNLLDKYYVTTSLAHGIGSSRVFTISVPESLEVFSMPKPRKKKGKTKIWYMGDDESRSQKGKNTLVDTLGVFNLGSFPYKNKLYHIVTDYETTYLSKIEDGRYNHIDTIFSIRNIFHKPEVIKTSEDHYLIPFETAISLGYLDIYRNRIKVLFIE